MKWAVEVRAKAENGKLITLTSVFNKKYQCEAYIKGVKEIATILDYVIVKKTNNYENKNIL